MNKHKAFQQYFDHQYNGLVLQAIRVVKDGPIAEDIVQECFIKLWDKRDEVTYDKSINGYVHVMVRNKCLDYLRSSNKKNKEATEEISDIHKSAMDQNNLEYEELQDKINAAIDKLPERCRQVFVLSRFEDMSYKAIADQLSISSKTVENQISKALKQLRLQIRYVFFAFSL